MHDNTEKQMRCQESYGSDRARHCEIREQSVGAVGRLTIDPGSNGGVTVKGWLRGDVLVRAKVETQAETQGAAASMASQVLVDSSGGQVRASGPETRGNSHSSWSVSYEIFTPQMTDLTLTANNGGINISDVRGQLRFEAQNGGVNLKRVSGDVSGKTVNGGVNVELNGPMWDGRQLDVTTTNGGVTLAVPVNFSAHVQAETQNGGMQSDFPINVSGEVRPRRLDFNLGSGGALIHVATTNGGVRIKRSDSQ
jgi:DUF4097 and DUF4098 domain-containing protein YvlB